MKINISPARTAAYKILYDVFENGAFSNVSVNKNLDMSLKNENDRRLAVHIVYGTIKKRYRLEKVLTSLSTTEISQINPKVKVIIYMSLYQIMYMDKIPEYALVNDAVNMAKFYGKQSATAFTNAVLRTALRKKKELIQKESDTDSYLYYEFGFPQWITKMLTDQFGSDFVLKYAKACEETPEVYIRTNTLKTNSDILSSALADKNIKTTKTYLPDTLKVLTSSNIFMSDEYKNGWFFAQDISGTLAGYVLDPKKDDKIIDMCSAPGGKSFHASILSCNTDILSCDINTMKLELVKRSAKQLGLSRIKVVKRDATKPLPEEEGMYDKVICDVPCSGLGVIRRKPEILSRITEEHIAELIKLQKMILTNGLFYLKKGGTLVYSTCTLNKDENLGVINDVLKQNKEASLAPIQLPFPLLTEHMEMKKGYLLLTPLTDQSDGFFMAKIVKK